MKPTHGKILYKDQDTASFRRGDWMTYRRKVQMVFQDPYSIYNPIYKVERVLRFVIKKFNITPEKDAPNLIEEALRTMRLRPQDVLGRYPHQLSGGERQRLMLARILIMKPELIVADEPVSMLDVSLRATFLDKILELKRKFGISSLYVTHDLNTAYYVADDVIVLCSGRIAENGKIELIIKNPLHPYTQLLLRCIPNPDPKNRWQDEITVGLVTSMTLRKSDIWQGCIYRDRCPYAMEICEKKPALVTIQPDHDVACFLHHDFVKQ